jgi:hypothetical protein
MQTQPQSHSTPNIIQAPYLKLKSIQFKLSKLHLYKKKKKKLFTLVPLTTQVQNLSIKNQNSSLKQSNKV